MDNTKAPKRFSDCNETINSWDENIFLGTDYQTGTFLSNMRYIDITVHILIGGSNMESRM